MQAPGLRSDYIAYDALSLIIQWFHMDPEQLIWSTSWHLPKISLLNACTLRLQYHCGLYSAAPDLNRVVVTIFPDYENKGPSVNTVPLPTRNLSYPAPHHIHITTSSLLHTSDLNQAHQTSSTLTILRSYRTPPRGSTCRPSPSSPWYLFPPWLSVTAGGLKEFGGFFVLSTCTCVWGC